MNREIFDPEIRRPGLNEIFARIKAEHPDWDECRAADEAKREYEYLESIRQRGI